MNTELIKCSWHLYFTAGTCGNCCDNQKAQVLEGKPRPSKRSHATRDS